MEQNQTYENIVKILQAMNIAYDEIEHEEVKTTDDSREERKKAGWAEGAGSKNIVFHAKGKFYLVVTTAGNEIKAKKFKKEFGTKDIRFAYEEELMTNTGCKIGAVPPFGHFNEELPIYVDSKIFEEKYFMFNPAVHTKSIRVTPENLRTIYMNSKNSVKIFEEKEDGMEFHEINR